MTDLPAINMTKPKHVLPWQNHFEETVNDDISELPTAEESFEGTESEEDCTDTEMDSEPPIDPELYSHKYQVIQPKPHILESIKQAKKRISSQSTSNESENPGPFQALEVDYAAAAIH